jgi:hypothetical protein
MLRVLQDDIRFNPVKKEITRAIVSIYTLFPECTTHPFTINTGCIQQVGAHK